MLHRFKLKGKKGLFSLCTSAMVSVRGVSGTMQLVPVTLCLRPEKMSFSTELSLGFLWVAVYRGSHFISQPFTKCLYCAQGTMEIIIIRRKEVGPKTQRWSKDPRRAVWTDKDYFTPLQCRIISSADKHVF